MPNMHTDYILLFVLLQDEGFNFSSNDGNGGNGGNGGDTDYRPIDAFIQGILED